MEPSQTNNEKKESQNTHEERIRKIDSEIKSKKKQLFEELENSQEETSRRRRHPKFSGSQIETLEFPTEKKENLKFAPSVINTLQITGKNSFSGGEIWYNEKHNLIIVQPFYMPLYIYDASTLLPLEGWETPQIDVFAFSFCSETDTFLFACGDGDLYSYDFSQKTLKKVQKLEEEFLLAAVTFIDAVYYVFSTYSGKLFVGNLEDGSINDTNFGKSSTWNLEKFENRNVLFSALDKGKLIIYRTNRLPKLPVVCSVQAHDNGINQWINMEKAVINGKEFIITRGHDGKMKVWHFVKGRMRLLRVIQIGEYVEGPCIYLDNYKMICTTKGKESLKFFSLISGELKNTFELKSPKALSVVFLKDKNAIGVADWTRKVLDIIQLHPKQEKEDFMMEV